MVRLTKLAGEDINEQNSMRNLIFLHGIEPDNRMVFIEHPPEKLTTWRFKRSEIEYEILENEWYGYQKKIHMEPDILMEMETVITQKNIEPPLDPNPALIKIEKIYTKSFN